MRHRPATTRRLGLARAFESKAMRFSWAQVNAAHTVHDAHITARPVEPAEEARVEKAMGLLGGQLAGSSRARAVGGRVAMALRAAGATLVHDIVHMRGSLSAG